MWNAMPMKKTGEKGITTMNVYDFLLKDNILEL